jgi:hypothetical protein
MARLPACLHACVCACVRAFLAFVVVLLVHAVVLLVQAGDMQERAENLLHVEVGEGGIIHGLRVARRPLGQVLLAPRRLVTKDLPMCARASDQVINCAIE